ncbi:MAG: ATPase [Acidobacteria bacterium]|nr:MAG: ATPase [Acidobacteriota bacterium]
MIRIGNGQGFWGDSIDAPIRILREGPIDYITLDYLAEVTMSIMQKQKMKRPHAGYATDFVKYIDEVLPELVERKVKVIANAGGVNPRACRDAILESARKQGISGLKVGIVEGDDILHRLDEFKALGEKLSNMDTGESLFDRERRILSANVYMPTDGIVEALDKGAQIVITGRSTDPGLVLGPIIHEMKWRSNDELALGTVAGHILECGAQCTGGNFTNWRAVPDMVRIGYPIAEVHEDRSLVITKHEGTGGLVSVDTVSEQLVYEMGNPEQYITPDCIADFTSIKLTQDGKNRVRVSGVRGKDRTPTLKVSISYLDGYKATGQLTISGPDALAKAEKCADVLWARLKHAGMTYEETHTEFLGSGVCHEGIVPKASQAPEIVLRVGVKDHDKGKVDRFGKEIAPLVTSGPPGVTGFAGGRPKAQEIVAYWPALIPRELIQTQVTVTEV